MDEVVAGTRRSAASHRSKPCSRRQRCPVWAPRPTYVHTQATVGFDWRTSAGYSRRGGFYGITGHDYNDRDKAFGFRQIDYEAIQHFPRPARDLGLLLPRARDDHARQERSEDPVLHAALAGRQLHASGLHEPALPRSEQPAPPGGVAHHGQPFLDSAVFYDAGKVTARRSDLDFDGIEARLRLRTPFPRPLVHAAPRRVGQGAVRGWSSSSRLPPSSEVASHADIDHSRHASCAQASGSLVLVAAALSLFAGVVSTQTLRFYDDDPIAREPESQDASNAQPYSIQQLYEQIYDLFVVSGYKPSGTRAQNINTIDEVPDSSWFTNRIGTTTSHGRGARARPERRRATRPVEMDRDQGKDLGRSSRLHRAGCQRRDVVPRVRSPVFSGRGDVGRGDRDARSSGRLATTRSNRT